MALFDSLLEHETADSSGPPEDLMYRSVNVKEETLWDEEQTLPNDLYSFKTEPMMENSYLEDFHGMKQEESFIMEDFVEKSEFKLVVNQNRLSSEFTCEHCSLGFKQKRRLLSHMQTHFEIVNSKPVPFIEENTLVIEGPELFEAMKFLEDSCDQPEGTKPTATSSPNRITGPFPCQFCDQSFWNQENRKIHSVIHSGENPYHCKVCDKRFARIEHVAAHSKTHKKHVRRVSNFKRRKAKLSHCNSPTTNSYNFRPRTRNKPKESQ